MLNNADEDQQGESKQAYAMVDIYGPPDPHLLAESSNTLWSCSQQADHRGLAVVEVMKIESVVAIVPHPQPVPGSNQVDLTGWFYVVEKMGLDVATMAGISVEDPHLDNE